MSETLSYESQLLLPPDEASAVHVHAAPIVHSHQMETYGRLEATLPPSSSCQTYTQLPYAGHVPLRLELVLNDAVVEQLQRARVGGVRLLVAHEAHELQDL